MAQTKEFVDASHALNELSHAMALLESENAKLRAERDYLLMNSNPTAAELRRVRSAWKKDRDENAKLRELVAEMYEAVKCCCDECWFGYGRNPAKCENENCGYRKEYVAMRELGVRLDG